jgi:hypothetical protein
MHECCFIVSFWFSLEQPLCLSMNRESIWRSQGLRNSIVWPHVAPRVFIDYFLKKSTSLRYFILKTLRGWERSLIPVLINIYLTLIGVGTWLGETTSKIEEGKAEDCWPDARPDTTLHDHCVRFRGSPAHPVVRRWISTGGLIGLYLRPIQYKRTCSVIQRALCYTSMFDRTRRRVRST